MARDRADQCPVIAVRQGADRPVPAHRHSPAPGHHLAVVEEQHVVLREVCLDAADVFVGDRVVEDEFWPDGAEGIPGLFIEITTVAISMIESESGFRPVISRSIQMRLSALGMCASEVLACRCGAPPIKA